METTNGLQDEQKAKFESILVGERVQNLRVPGESGYQTNESGPVPGKLLILRAGNRVPN